VHFDKKSFLKIMYHTHKKEKKSKANSQLIEACFPTSSPASLPVTLIPYTYLSATSSWKLVL
jgi:hypothetical protein